MSGEFLKTVHVCQVPDKALIGVEFGMGTIWRCDECRQVWKAINPTNSVLWNGNYCPQGWYPLHSWEWNSVENRERTEDEMRLYREANIQALALLNPPTRWQAFIARLKGGLK